MTGNKDDGGSHAARGSAALSNAFSSLRTAGSEFFAEARKFKDDAVAEFKQATSTLDDDIAKVLARKADEHGRLIESLALQQGETPYIAARIRNFVVRNHPIYGSLASTPSNDKGGPSGPAPGTGAVK